MVFAELLFIEVLLVEEDVVRASATAAETENIAASARQVNKIWVNCVPRDFVFSCITSIPPRDVHCRQRLREQCRAISVKRQGRIFAGSSITPKGINSSTLKLNNLVAICNEL